MNAVAILSTHLNLHHRVLNLLLNWEPRVLVGRHPSRRNEGPEPVLDMPMEPYHAGELERLVKGGCVHPIGVSLVQFERGYADHVAREPCALWLFARARTGKGKSVGRRMNDEHASDPAFRRHSSMYYDLCVPYGDCDVVVHRMRLSALLALGYDACCASQSVEGQVSPSDRCAETMGPTGATVPRVEVLSIVVMHRQCGAC